MFLSLEGVYIEFVSNCEIVLNDQHCTYKGSYNAFFSLLLAVRHKCTNTSPDATDLHHQSPFFYSGTNHEATNADAIFCLAVMSAGELPLGSTKPLHSL